MKVLLVIYLILSVFTLSAAADTIKIAAIFAQTGEAAAISNEHLIAVEFAVSFFVIFTFYNLIMIVIKYKKIK